MTVGEFADIVIANDIPDSVTMLSDSGWECSATDMNGVYYNEKEKVIVFTQKGNKFDRNYYGKDEWHLIHCKEEPMNEYTRFN